MTDLDYFYLLKDALLRKFRENYPYWQKSIHEFKGQEISRFQDLLLENAGGRISEKWFYTHIKPLKNEKLPRIDVLNLLSDFSGHGDWAGFISAHQKKLSSATKTSKRFNKQIIIIAGFGLLVLFLFAFGNLNQNIVRTYKACFVDADLGTPLKETAIEITILADNESPASLQVNSEACFETTTREQEILFVVNALYYQTDTISRILKGKHFSESIALKRDDYATMIHIFSTSNLKDWKKRRQQLGRMIAENVMIIQVAQNSGIGIEMYNKEEFINKLTLPVSGLKNLKILSTQYDDQGRILNLRFVQE